MGLAAGSQGVLALAGQYGFQNAACFVLEHIETLKHAENALANRCGQVLEAVVGGFGIGAETGLVLVGLGQALLGNPLTVSSVAATAANPVVMTCAAIGAVHYGWNALSDKERDAVLETVSTAFEVGAELVRSLAGFVIDRIRSLLSKENLDELKQAVASVAAVFGNTLSHVTRAIGDRAYETLQSVSGAASWAASAAWQRVPAIRKQGG